MAGQGKRHRPPVAELLLEPERQPRVAELATHPGQVGPGADHRRDTAATRAAQSGGAWPGRAAAARPRPPPARPAGCRPAGPGRPPARPAPPTTSARSGPRQSHHRTEQEGPVGIPEDQRVGRRGQGQQPHRAAGQVRTQPRAQVTADQQDQGGHGGQRADVRHEHQGRARRHPRQPGHARAAIGKAGKNRTDCGPGAAYPWAAIDWYHPPSQVRRPWWTCSWAAGLPGRTVPTMPWARARVATTSTRATIQAGSAPPPPRRIARVAGEAALRAGVRAGAVGQSRRQRRRGAGGQAVGAAHPVSDADHPSGRSRREAHQPHGLIEGLAVRPPPARWPGTRVSPCRVWTMPSHLVPRVWYAGAHTM